MRVNQGTLEISIGSKFYIVNPDETIIFDGHTQHIYKNTGETAVHCTLIISYT